MLPTAAIPQSIGKQLMAARTARGLSVEDVAFKTHIPAARVSELENDDFSNFANLTYAKGFLKIYSNYLDIDLSEYLEQFSTSDFANISGHDYIQSANTGLTSLSMAVAPDNQSGRGGGMFGIILILITLIGVPIWYWTQDKNPPAPVEKPPENTGPAPKAKIIEEAPPIAPPTAPGEVVEDTRPTPPVPPPVPPPISTPGGRPVEVKPAIMKAKVIPEDEPAPVVAPTRPNP